MNEPKNDTAVRVHGLIGREEERARLRALLEVAVGGRGRLALISGEAGIGKTRLAEATEEAALELGMRVLWGSCWEGPGAPSFWPWLQIVRACSRVLGTEALATELGAGAADLAPIMPESFGLAADGGRAKAVGDPEQLRFKFFESVAALLRTMIQREPLLVVVEDLHWADESSLLLLRFLVQELRRQRVLLLGTYRSPDLEPESALATQLADFARAGAVLAVPGLSRREVGRLIADEAGGEPPSRFVTVVHERSGGNPFVVKETLRLLRSQGHLELAQSDPEFELGVPPSVRDLILGRLRVLTDRCGDLLSWAAVGGREFTIDVLEWVSGGSYSEISDLLDEAARAGVVSLIHGHTGRYEFTHALMRETIYNELPASRREALHALYGETIERLFAENLDPWLGELGYHFYRAAGGRSSRKASEYQERAGRQALEALAYEEASSRFERALESSPPEDTAERRIELLLLVGDARMRAGNWTGGIQAYEDAAAAAKREGLVTELARAALGLGAGLGGFEVRMFDRRQIVFLSEALEALGNEYPELRAWLLARLSVALSFVEDQERRIEMAQEAVDIARPANASRALAYALAAHCDAIAGPSYVERRLSEALEIIRLARMTDDHDIELLGLRLRFIALLDAGETAAAERAAQDFADVANEVRQPLYLWYVPLWKGLFALMRGRLDDCERWMHEAGVLGARANSGNSQILIKSQRLNWLLESGRNEEACTLIDDYDVALFPSSWGWRAGVFAAAGRFAEARVVLDRLSGSDFENVPDDAEWLGSICMAVEACGLLRHDKAATRIYRELLPYGDCSVVDGIGAAYLGSVFRYLGVLAHVLGLWREAAEHFEKAVEHNRRAGATLIVAHTLRQFATMLSDPDGVPDRARAESMLQEAIAIYAELSLHHWVQRATGVLSDVAGESARASGNAFRRDGEVWSLTYDGTKAQLKDAKGLHDIARLIAGSGREFHVLDLVGAQQGEPDVSREVIRAQADTGEVIDAPARAAYRRRLTELEEEINDAETYGDAGRAQKARAEHDAITAQLAAAYGLAGRPRRTGDPTERARSAVTWRIRASLARIEREHPTLAAHLRNSLRTGTFCSYAPEKPVTWEV